MARKRNSGGGGGGGSSWLNTYSDMVTLLLTFFVLMISMSNMDEEKYNAFVEAMQQALNNDEIVEIVENMQSENPEQVEAAMDALYENLKEYVEDNGKGDAVTLSKSQDVIYVRFDSSVFFKANEYNLRDESYDILKFIGDGLKEFEDDIKLIAVCGHTAKPAVEVDPERAWRLAGERASVVANYLESDRKIDSSKIILLGYGDNYPIASNDTEEGMRKNRRVELVIIGKDSKVEMNVYDALEGFYKNEEGFSNGDGKDLFFPGQNVGSAK